MSRRFVQLIVVSSAVAMAVSACSSSGGGGGSATGGSCTVKLGSVFSQTGAAAAFGSDGERAIHLAVDDINAKGFKVGGKTCKFSYKAVDLASDPNTAAARAQDLITGFGAKFIFGPDLAAAVPPIATAVQRAGDVMDFSVSTGLDAYAGKGDQFFRLAPPDQTMVNEGYIPTVAKALPAIKTISMMMTDDETGHALATSYATAFKANGVTVTQTEFYAATTTNFAPIVERIDKNKSQGMFIGYNNDSAAAAIMDASLEAGLPKVFITRGISAQPGVDRQSKLTDYTWLVLGADPKYPANAKQKKFIDHYTSTFKIAKDKMTYFPFVHYDYPFMLVQAMKKAGTTTDIKKIAAALRGSSYNGVVPVSFDSKGINNSPMGAGILKDGSGAVTSFGGGS